MGAAADGGPPPPSPSLPSPLAFELLARSGAARAARMTLPHHACLTPMFMPVGTQGAVKGLTAAQLEELGCQTILANTYHMASSAASLRRQSKQETADQPTDRSPTTTK